MRVGQIEIASPVLLAPMAAVTDLPFRTVCEELGAGFTITEFLSAHAITAGDPKTLSKMTASLGGRRFGVQIFGREAWRMQEAARVAVSIGASLVDINMGCPVGEAALVIDEAGHPSLRREGCVGCGVCVRDCIAVPPAFTLHYAEG